MICNKYRMKQRTFSKGVSISVVIIIAVIMISVPSSKAAAPQTLNHFIVNAFDGSNTPSDELSTVTSIIPPPPSGTSVHVELYIYGGLGEISLSYPDDSFTNGTLVYEYANSQIDISAVDIPSGYVFYQWITNCGNIGNSMASSTTFTVTANGTLAMIIQQSSTDYNWGGYIETGNDITSVSTQLILPSSVSYVSHVTDRLSSVSLVDFWVGIGGSSDNLNLWQAGVSIEINSSSSSPYVYAWYEYLYADNNGPAPINVTGLQIGLGDTVDITVSYNPSTGTSYYHFDVLNTDSQKSGNVLFSPNTMTGEWIGEDPGGEYWVIPDFGSVVFSADNSTSDSSYTSLYAPIINEETWDTWQYNYLWTITQEMNPGTVSSGNQFTLSYTQTTTE